MDRSIAGSGPLRFEGPIAVADGGIARVAALRGARIEVNASLVTRVVIGACLVTLTVLAVAFFFIGAHKNAQITELREHGTTAVVTVSSCRGLLGGSGSNAAGYACTGALTLDGRRFQEAIPGSSLYEPGTKLQAVAADNGSGLFTLPKILAKEHASWTVYVVPSVLVVALAAVLGVVALKRRGREVA